MTTGTTPAREATAAGTQTDTLPKLLLQRLQRAADVALRHKSLGIWHAWTWDAVAEEVQLFAHALSAGGFARGDKLALLGGARPQLLCAALAAQSLGGTAVLIERTLAADAVAGIVCSEAIRFAYGQSRPDVDKLLAARAAQPTLRWIAVQDAEVLSDYPDERIIHEAAARLDGREHRRALPYLFVTTVQEGRADDTALASFGASPDGKVYSHIFRHGELIAFARALRDQVELRPSDEAIGGGAFSRPLDVLLGFASWLTVGYRLNLPESPETVFGDRREIGPTYYYGSVADYTALQREVAARLPAERTLRRHVIDYALKSAAHSPSTQKRIGLGARLALIPARWLLLNPLRDVLGLSRARVVLSADGPLPKDAVDLLRGLRVPVQQATMPQVLLGVQDANLTQRAAAATSDATAGSDEDYRTAPQPA